jgi:hypothetical protein
MYVARVFSLWQLGHLSFAIYMFLSLVVIDEAGRSASIGEERLVVMLLRSCLPGRAMSSQSL